MKNHDIFVQELVRLSGVSEQYASAAYFTSERNKTMPVSGALMYHERFLTKTKGN